MINNRGSFRLRKQVEITWSIPEQKIEGTGKIFNVSLTGINFETDRLFTPDHGMMINFKSAEMPHVPSKGKLVWYRKVGADKDHYQCGIRFPSESSFNPGWAKWMEDNILKLADTGDNTILNRYISSDEPE